VSSEQYLSRYAYNIVIFDTIRYITPSLVPGTLYCRATNHVWHSGAPAPAGYCNQPKYRMTEPAVKRAGTLDALQTVQSSSALHKQYTFCNCEAARQTQQKPESTPQSVYPQHADTTRERKRADTTGRVPVGWPFPTLKYRYIFKNKIYGSDFIKQHSDTVMV